MSQWDELTLLYNKPNFSISSGTMVKIKVEMESKLDEYDTENLSTIIDTWSFPKNEKDIRPFKLINISFVENTFEADIRYKKKDKDIDELRLLCQDLLDFFNYFKNHIIKWDCTLLSN